MEYFLLTGSRRLVVLHALEPYEEICWQVSPMLHYGAVQKSRVNIFKHMVQTKNKKQL